MNRRGFIQGLGVVLAGLPRVAWAGRPGVQFRAAMRGKKLLIVPYSHMDWAWTHTAQWQGDRAALVLGEVLDILKTAPQYRFFVDTWNEFFERFLDRAPERVEEFRTAVKNKQIAICGGTVANSHPAWMESETLIRDIVLGRRLFRTVVPGYSPDVMVHCDVTPGSSQMPQILRKAGYRGYRFTRPDESLTAEGVPRNFSWRGLDGSEIMVSRGPYGGIFKNNFTGFDSDWEGAVSRFYKYEVSSNSQPGDSELVWLPMGADDCRPLRVAIAIPPHDEKPIPLLAFMRQWRMREDVPLTFATPVEFFNELEKQADKLPVHQGILDPAMWTFWYGLNGNQGLRRWRTRADRALVSAEAAASCATILGEAYPEDRFEGLWHDLLRASSHAQMWLFQKDYDAHLTRVKEALDGAQRIQTDSLQKLAGCVRLPHRLNSVLLWNPLCWDRTEVVQLWLSFQPGTWTNFYVRDADGHDLPYQVVDLNYEGGGKPVQGGAIKEAIVLVKASVPALGYATLYFGPADGTPSFPAVRSDASALDVEFAKIEFSPSGIKSLTDTATGSVYANAGNVLYNEIRDIGPLHYGPVDKTLRFEAAALPRVVSGPLCSTFDFQAPLGPHRVHIVGRCYPHAARISFDTTIESAGGSGHFMASLGLPEGGAFSADVQFGVEERNIQKIAYKPVERLCKNVFYGAHWVDFAHPRGSVTLIGTTGEKGYQFSPEEQTLGHFLLMTVTPADNWERFATSAQLGTGTQKFDYQLLLHNGDWRIGEVQRRAQEAMQPIRVVYPDHLSDPSARSLPTRMSFVRVSPSAVQASAVFREGRFWFVRIFESTGAHVEANISMPFQISEAMEVDLHGEPRRKVLFSKRRVIAGLQPWEILTLRIA